MTSPRDLATAAKVSLEICAKCGWYDGYNHAERCSPHRGRAAQRLIALVPEVRAGQLGYGDNCVAFDLADNFTIVFDCEDRKFAFSRLHLLDRLTLEEAAELVRALRGWLEGKRDARQLRDLAH